MALSRVLVIDNGLFIPLAQRLGEKFDTFYWTPWGNAFPLSREVAPGTGLEGEGVHRVNDPLRFLMEMPPDFAVVPDLFNDDLEAAIRAMEIPVFGPNGATRLETDRWHLKEFLEENSLPVIHSVELEGIDALREYLEDPKNEDKWVKVSAFRGDHETEHHENWEKTEADWFDDLKHRLGPLGKQIHFIVEDPIESDTEIGVDTICVDGQYLQPLAGGYEIKDAGYVGRVGLDTQLFDPTLRAFGHYFREHRARTFFSNEMRVVNGEVFSTDATTRVPSPPGGVMIAAIRNLPTVIERAASGEAINLDWGDTQWLAEIVLKSPKLRDIHGWLEVDVPKAHRQHVKLHHFCRIDGRTWIIPHDSGMVEFGSAIGYGTTLDDAARMAQEVAESVKAHQLQFDANVLEKAEEEIEKGEKAGIYL